MRKSHRGNPWHDERGRFTSGPRGIYTNENEDGSVYAQFFADSDCTDEYDNHEFSPGEIKEHGGINGAMEYYLGVKKSEKSPTEYEERTRQREEQQIEEEKYERNRTRAAGIQAENMIEDKVEYEMELEAELAAESGDEYDDSADTYDYFYEQYADEIKESVNGCYKDFYGEADYRVEKMSLEQMQDFCSSPESVLNETADNALQSNFDSDENTDYLKECMITSYCEDSPTISNRYEKLVKKAGKERLFRAARREEKDTLLVSNQFALGEVKRRGLYHEYVKTNN